MKAKVSDRLNKDPDIVKIKPGPQADPISAALQRLHHSVIDETVPDSFHDLVALIGQKIEDGVK